MLPFLGHCYNEIFKTLHGYNFAQDLHFNCSFDDLDFVSRSQMCQKYKFANSAF